MGYDAYYFNYPEVKVDPEHCYHNWKRYVGAREVYDYCTRCDAKEFPDWKTIGEGKKKNVDKNSTR